ncbi:MAG: flavodoxin family protein [Candidatus Promineifilaceae bacterium]|jgi:flavodoxin
MKTVVIYHSKFGNTQLVAEAMAGVLQAAGPSRALSADRLTIADLQDVDLVVLGSPTHKMNLPVALRPLLDSLPKRCLRGKSVAAFDTSYKMNWLLARFTAAPRLLKKMRKLGGKQAVRPETFFVVGREGPLFDGELERAQAWAAALIPRPAKELIYHGAQ